MCVGIIVGVCVVGEGLRIDWIANPGTDEVGANQVLF